ncbi:Sister chromatid cohesion protein PDS5 A [Xenoophorus captivus]|uniref:Sister chromatid cohesion protein PDS5 A n=1 Tax=Xenoophorus captivus TaxID=1517983 RepID=A0ABV0S2V0_9TELE
MNHPDLAKDLTEYLKVRSHDPEEAIRHDVIVTIINAGKKDLNLVNDQLLGFVRERTLDKRHSINPLSSILIHRCHFSLSHIDPSFQGPK